jgi:hypothetical protein
MRKFIVFALFFLAAAGGGTIPAGWKTIKDSKSLCQIAIPASWTPGAENTGSALFEDASVAIAIVTSQPGQTFKPISESLLRGMNVPKEKVFENSATRAFYQDRTGRDASEQSALSAMVPGKGGTCSSRVSFLPSVPEETARKIVLSVGPVE